MKKGDMAENGFEPCGRKWKLLFVYSAGSILCLASLLLIFVGCTNPGKVKPVAKIQAGPSAAQSVNDTKPTAVQPGTDNKTAAAQSDNDKAMLVFRCQPGSGKLLTSAQATQLATLLANNKAAAFYQCQPFHYGQPATFVDGHWHWRQTVPGDYEAIVDVAADGSTNKVIVNLLNSTVMGVP